jgi:putative spermidine/putrescine transport system permease protein
MTTLHERRLGFSAALYRRPRTRLGVLLAPTTVWIIGIYLVSLGLLLVNAFWQLNEYTSKVDHAFSFDNFTQILTNSTYRAIVGRTVGIAALVTVIDVLLAFPVAYYVSRIASRRTKAFVLILVVLPLWSSYLVRVFAWRTILAKGGLLSWAADKLHVGIDLGYSTTALVIVFVYLWLPFVILPIITAFERVPSSLLEASADLGGKPARTFRAVLLPMVLPGVVAGSIFSFSLTLGDYIAPQLASNTQFIGNVVYTNVGVANNVPLAAAFALVPIVIITGYLLGAKRTGAFEAM